MIQIIPFIARGRERGRWGRVKNRHMVKSTCWLCGVQTHSMCICVSVDSEAIIDLLGEQLIHFDTENTVFVSLAWILTNKKMQKLTHWPIYQVFDVFIDKRQTIKGYDTWYNAMAVVPSQLKHTQNRLSISHTSCSSETAPSESILGSKGRLGGRQWRHVPLC